jgi:hypothetical protein
MKCLRKSHCLPRHALDVFEVLLSLHGGLEHGLKRLPLMNGIKRLYHAMLRKVPAVASLKTNVKTLLKSSAEAHWEGTLVCEGAGSTHELVVILLNTCDNLVSVAVSMNLADVVNCSVRLHRIAWA